MAKKINNIDELNDVVYDRWTKLDEVESKYLSETGMAAKEAYRAIIWHLCFHNSLESLKGDEEFMDLVNIPGKHPEYYNIIRKLNNFLMKEGI